MATREVSVSGGGGAGADPGIEGGGAKVNYVYTCKFYPRPCPCVIKG